MMNYDGKAAKGGKNAEYSNKSMKMPCNKKKQGYSCREDVKYTGDTKKK